MSGLIVCVKRGESIIIEHAGEKLIVYFEDKKGSGHKQARFVGPRSFNVQRANRSKKENETTP
jgi:hypothetical protein